MSVELNEFRSLMSNSLRTTRVLNDAQLECVVYVDKNALVCISNIPGQPGLEKFGRFAGIVSEGSNRLTMTFGKAVSLEHEVITNANPELTLEFTTSKTRDYMAKMLPRLFGQ
jgi:hypothetical protein